MSDDIGPGAAGRPLGDTEPVGVDEIRDDIEQTRAELGETVDALSAKLDVKAQGRQKLHDAGAKASDAVGRARESAPEPVQHALDQVGEKVQPVARQAADKAAPYRKQILIAAAVALVVALGLRRRGRGEDDS